MIAFCLNLWLQFGTLTDDQSLPKTVNFGTGIFLPKLFTDAGFVLFEHQTFAFLIKEKKGTQKLGYLYDIFNFS